MLDFLHLGSSLSLRAFARQGSAVAVHPTPATHAILTVLKAGETVYQAGELPKTL